MSRIIREFDSYAISYYSANFAGPRIYISCMANNALVGRIEFLDVDSPGVTPHRAENLVLLRYPTRQFSDIMSILLHEKPLFLLYDSSGPHGTLGTGKEPIGEMEVQIGS